RTGRSAVASSEARRTACSGGSSIRLPRSRRATVASKSRKCGAPHVPLEQSGCLADDGGAPGSQAAQGRPGQDEGILFRAVSVGRTSDVGLQASDFRLRKSELLFHRQFVLGTSAAEAVMSRACNAALKRCSTLIVEPSASDRQVPSPPATPQAPA